MLDTWIRGFRTLYHWEFLPEKFSLNSWAICVLEIRHRVSFLDNILLITTEAIERPSSPFNFFSVPFLPLNEQNFLQKCSFFNKSSIKTLSLLQTNISHSEPSYDHRKVPLKSFQNTKNSQELSINTIFVQNLMKKKKYRKCDRMSLVHIIQQPPSFYQKLR